VAVRKQITFDLLGQTGNLLDIQKAFASQARKEGWEPHEITVYIAESMEKKSLFPLAQACAGIPPAELEALRAEYRDPAPGRVAGPGPAGNVVIVGLDLPFNAMVELMVKWALAAIPALVILFTVAFTLNHLFTAFVQATPPRRASPPEAAAPRLQP